MKATSDSPAIWNGTLIPGYRTAPMGAVFLPHFHLNQQECQWEAPVCSPSFNICSCNRSEKSKCPSQGSLRANGVVYCMPDAAPKPSLAPAPPSLEAKEEPQHVMSEWPWMAEQANEHTSGNNLSSGQLSTVSLTLPSTLNTQTHIFSSYELKSEVRGVIG